MENVKESVKVLTAKDEKKAVEAAVSMVNNSNIDMFKELVVQSEYLFPFIRDNVVKRLEKVICKANYENIFNFFDCYSLDYYPVFVQAMKIFGDENTSKRFLEILTSGSNSQKTYAARYFEYCADERACDELVKNIFCNDENLSDACSAALGAIKDKKSYELALQKLKSNDDFEKLDGLNFFVNYAYNPPMTEIFTAMKTSGMPENFAGKIPYLVPLTTLIKENQKNGLSVADNILSGFGEILPLSEIFSYELFDVISFLSTLKEPAVSTVLLRAKIKFATIAENDEYIFDEDKNTKTELKAVNQLLNSLGDDFWETQKSNIINELSTSQERAISALSIIQDLKISNAVPNILEMLYEFEDETLLCQGIETLKSLNAISYLEKDEILARFSNETLRAIVQSYFE